MGKSSLAKVLSSSDGGFSLEYKNKEYDEKSNNLFHIISDQNNRNIIKGEADDFLIGDNIKREYELKKSIDTEFEKLFRKNLPKVLKEKFSISTMSSLLIGYVKIDYFKIAITDLANNRSKGSEINRDDFIKEILKLKYREVERYEEDKINYLMNNYKDKNSIIYGILNIKNEEIDKNENIHMIDEHDEAIKILNKFHYKIECIVCDSNIDSVKLFQNKSENRKKIFKDLDTKTKDILKNIVEQLPVEDPFNIKESLMNALQTGNREFFKDLQDEIYFYFDVFNKKIENLFVDCLKDTNLIENSREYKRILENPPEFDEEDILLIEKIINENMRNKIRLTRDDHNIKLYIGDRELTNTDRGELHLSTGEQNFISLAFELLRAKKSESEIIILDDPISSFDSIFKNKIAFIIVKFLKDKKQIILTHNTELIKLLEHQKNGCFNLYLFNNTEKEGNGFIKVKSNEQDILLYLDKLLDLFRNRILDEIEDEKNFLISMIPFMRGYSQLIASSEEEKQITNDLTKLMHGYEDEEKNLTEIYYKLFGEKIEKDYYISAQDIIKMNIKDVNILKENKYPLLAKILKHNLNYLYLRMIVEAKLVKLYSIDTKKTYKLGDIIRKAFDGEIDKNRENRIFLNSKKTLLNEFNHFEGNMNIFQPAIDITDTALKEEIDAIISFVNFLDK